jgi:hypothetical protein
MAAHDATAGMHDLEAALNAAADGLARSICGAIPTGRPVTVERASVEGSRKRTRSEAGLAPTPVTA